MTISVDVLRQLHRIHQQLAEWKGRLKRGPKLVQLGEQALQRNEQELADCKEAVMKTRMASDGQQLQLREREDKIKDLQRKLNECKTNTEYTALGNQIAAERQANSVLEDEIFEKLERLDALREEILADETKLEHTKNEFQKTRDRVEGERETLEAEVARVTVELQQTETALPAEVKQEYHRIVKARGEEALAPVDGETCGSCFQLLTPQTMNELALSRVVFCKSCGCLLYLPEDRSVGAEQ